MILSRKLVVGSFVTLSVATLTTIIAACGSDDSSKFHDPDAHSPIFGDASLGADAGDDPYGNLYKNDPPPAYCGPNADGGTKAPPIGGTLDCPDDKNLPGCGCSEAGKTAACWTGLRKNRNLGDCKDGTTTCYDLGENRLEWGPCLGQTLPKTQGSGAEACTCFSVGLWKIANTAPCVWNDNGYYAYSTIEDDATGKLTNCQTDNHLAAGQTPASNWSHDTLTTDCAGSFDLVFRIRQGDYNNPKDTDCILGESTVHANYQTAKVEQALPDLPAWHGTDADCARKWEDPTITPDNVSPGYGEMIVKGETEACQDPSSADGHTKLEFVFNRVQYCARICRDPAHAQDDICVKCQLKGTGSFGGQ